MKTEHKQIEVYIADDGREFIDAKECEQYEKKLEDYRKHLKIFTLRYSPDLTETGCFQRVATVVVYSRYFWHHAIVERYAVDVLNQPILESSVMGYGFQQHFGITEVKFPQSELENVVHGDLIILAPTEVINDPMLMHFIPGKYETRLDFDYMYNWKFK